MFKTLIPSNQTTTEAVLGWIFRFYLVAALLVTAIVVTVEYHTLSNKLLNGAKAQASLASAPTAAALWYLDTDQLSELVTRIAYAELVDGLAILGDDGALIAHAGQLPAEVLERDVSPLYPGVIREGSAEDTDFRLVEVELVEPRSGSFIGAMQVYTQSSRVFWDLLPLLSATIAGAILKTLLLGGAIWFALRRLVEKPVTQLNSEILALNRLTADQSHIETARGSLGQMVVGVQSVRQRLSQHISLSEAKMAGMESSNQKLMRALDEVQDAIALYTHEGTLLVANRAFGDPVVEQVLSENDLVGQGVLEARASGSWCYEDPQTGANYQVELVELCLDPDTVFLLRVTDVTELIRPRRLLEAAREKEKEMYAVIGHELRTPTAVLKMLLSDVAQDQDARQIDTKLLTSTVDQLLGVIETLRSVAQPERMHEAAKEQVVLTDLISSQLQMLTPLGKRYGVKLNSELSQLSGRTIEMRVQLLRQLLSNLTKNAIVHSGATEVTVGAEGKVEGTLKSVSIWVEDNGSGIAEAEQERLFSAYERGNSEAEGTGLGLYISRQIANSLGGELLYEPASSGGARFVLRFVTDVSSGTSNREVEAGSLEGKRVLLAEDNLTIQMLTRRILEKRGATVEIANNAKEALALYEHSAFDLVISDIFMPGGNGYELVAALRSNGCDLPIVGLTAATIGEETERMLGVGANVVLSKPINVDKLLEFLASTTRPEFF